MSLLITYIYISIFSYGMERKCCTPI